MAPAISPGWLGWPGWPPPPPSASAASGGLTPRNLLLELDADLRQGLVLDLADALLSDADDLADLLKGHGLLAVGGF